MALRIISGASCNEYNAVCGRMKADRFDTGRAVERAHCVTGRKKIRSEWLSTHDGEQICRAIHVPPAGRGRRATPAAALRFIQLDFCNVLLSGCFCPLVGMRVKITFCHSYPLNSLVSLLQPVIPVPSLSVRQSPKTFMSLTLRSSPLSYLKEAIILNRHLGRKTL